MIEAAKELSVRQMISDDINSVEIVQLEKDITELEIISSSTPPTSRQSMFWVDESVE